MAKRSRPRWSVVLVSLALSAGSCSDNPSEPTPASIPTTINLSATEASFTHLGQTLQVTATLRDNNGAPVNAPLVWSVDNSEIATVAPNGAITAVANGTTTVRATAGALSAGVAVSVTQRPASLTASPTGVVLTAVGATQALAARVTDAGGHAVAGAQVTWTSSNHSVATVSNAGVITAMGAGTATITAQSGNLSATVSLSVQIAVINLVVQTPPGMEEMIRGVNVRFVLRAVARDGNGQISAPSNLRWSSSNNQVATIDSLSGAIRTVGQGSVTFTASATNATPGTWTRNVVRIRELQVHPYLATPINGALWEIPVVLIEYHPTADGYGLDTLKSPDFWWMNPMSLDSLARLTLRIAQRRKMMVEQGSRFRGSRDASALPSLGYRVVKHVIVYDQVPAHPTKRMTNLKGHPWFEDWHKAFAELELVPVLRAQRVREVWVAWSAFDAGVPSYIPHAQKNEDMRFGWESNMASPTTGDISNSDRDPHDMPVIDHTYIIYGINFRRSQAEAVHNVGHQLEAMLSYVNYRQDGNHVLFWRNFVGQNAANQFITGRTGWTHMPPNTTQHYEYLNATSVMSDIEDWRPDNSGVKTSVNVDTWASLNFPWPGERDFGQRIESQWYTYWFQNFPGRGNRIPHGNSWMTNWWAFVADWDAAIRSGLGLYSNTPAAQAGSARYRFAPAMVQPPPVQHERR